MAEVVWQTTVSHCINQMLYTGSVVAISSVQVQTRTGNHHFKVYGSEKMPCALIPTLSRSFIALIAFIELECIRGMPQA